MKREAIVAGALACWAAGHLGASIMAANPSERLFASQVTAAAMCRIAPETAAFAGARTFLTSSAMVPDLQLYAAPQTGSGDLIALLEISK
jgi:hypothetical protein